MNARNTGAHDSQPARGADIADAVKAGASGARDKAIWPMPNGIDAAARQARVAAERFSRTLGFSGEEGERLARQSKRNMEAVSECRSVLTKAFQASSDSGMEIVQAQWKRNFDGMERLMQAKSVQEFGAIQGELVRETLEHILKDSRAIAERSMRAADEAGQLLSALTDQSPPEPA